MEQPIRDLKDFTDYLKRYKKVLGTVALGLGLMSCGYDRVEGGQGEVSRPANVIVLTADDLGWKDLGCYGNGDIETPHMDSLAREGALFENAFVAAPSCSPSRAALITGQYPHTNGVTGLTHRYPKKSLKKSSITIAGELKDAGYATAIDGKWHPAVFSPVRWFGYDKRMTGFGLFQGSWDIDDAEDAKSFIRKNRERPFYLEMNFIQNHRIDHGKFYYSEEYPVDPDAISIPENYALPDWPEIREDLAKFYSQTMEMDAIIGEVLNELEELGLRDDTMIILLSDNGQPYPGAKTTHYDRGIGTPLLVSWPDEIGKGIVIDDLVSSIDIMPTILDGLGLEIPGAVEGISFLPLLKGETGASGRDAVFSEMDHHAHYIPGRAVRTADWKYIRNYSDSAYGLDELNDTDWAYELVKLSDQPWTLPRVREELYDLSADPHERVNLAADPSYRNQLVKLSLLLDKHMEETNDHMLGKEFLADYRVEDYQREE